MIDLIYLAHNRLEFTKASLGALAANTNWQLVDRFLIYDDNSVDGTREYLQDWCMREVVGAQLIIPRFAKFGHPVIVMRDYIFGYQNHSIFAKIDSDTMVPPGWLDEALGVMERHSDLDFLGIEAMNEVVADVGTYGMTRGYTPARFIGGIGLMRTRAFYFTQPNPLGRFHGFTEWQEINHTLRKGWINPSIPVFLLDRMPMEPWRSLSKEYIERFGQREWGPYNPRSTELWDWFCK